MGARKNEKLEVRLIAVHNIRIDRELQSRAFMSTDYVRESSEAILRGDIFPAVDVFWDGKKYWLADGFHRVEAHRKGGVIDVTCMIHYGKRRDAIIYSAGANQKFWIPRSIEDKTRAAYMLFEDSEWQNKSPSQIAAHIGVGPILVRKMRLQFCEERGVEMPAQFVNALDRKYTPIGRTKGSPPRAAMSPFRRRCLSNEDTG